MLNSGPGQNYLNSAPNINYLWSSLIVEELDRLGIDTFVVCPGSRSAPLAMAVAGNGVVQGIVHHDERGAAFHAAGHAKATGRPVVFICTSGTAAANALPAVIEAAQSFVPLILLTADRPPELQDTGANQTIHQPALYEPYVRWSCNLPCPDTHVAPEMVLTTVDQAVYRATRAPSGPVHMNCPFREPLAPVHEDFDVINYTRSLASWFDGAFTQYSGNRTVMEPGLAQRVNAVITQSGRGILVVGALNRPEDVEAAKRVAGRLDWPVLPDVASGLRLSAQAGPYIPYYDRMLASDTWRQELGTAQVVLQIGGPVTSKNLLQFLAAVPSRQYVRVAPHPMRHDPSHRMSHRIEMTLGDLADTLDSHPRAYCDPEWNDHVLDASNRVGQVIEEFLGAEPVLTEVTAARAVAGNAPAESVLFLGNSMPIRDMDMYGAIEGGGPLVAVNRGASGIDGGIATAAAYAEALRWPVTAVVGDLALLHDLNSLPLARHARAPVVVVVLNNDGGGIFSLLPIAEHNPAFEGYFGTPHGMTFEAFAQGFHCAYTAPATVAEFEKAYGDALSEGGCTVIEVHSARDANAALHRELEAAIITRLSA